MTPIQMSRIASHVHRGLLFDVRRDENGPGGFVSSVSGLWDFRRVLTTPINR
jgi:hypothetical protein